MVDRTPPEGKQHIVIVDDEEALVWSLANRIAKLRPSYVVETANDGENALKLVRQPLDLLVTDIRMPGMSGLELIVEARRILPALPIIVMTAFPSPDMRDQVALRGFIEYLEKPFEFERFLACTDGVLARRPVGFSGAISVQTLPDIVQLYGLSNTTGALVVKHDDEEGRIWFASGAITHATTMNGFGVEAFYEIMLWSGGLFSMQIGAMATERSINCGWTELIMESCRRLDDARRRRDSASEPSTKAGWTLAPPPDADQETDFDLGIRDEHVVVDLIVTDATRVPRKEERTMANIKDSLAKLNGVEGFVGAALVDSESGMLLGQEGGGSLNFEIAAASNTEVVRAKRKAIKNLNLKDEIEDILITLGKQYHLIRPLRTKGALFFYMVLDRQRANLALARLGLADVEKDLQT